MTLGKRIRQFRLQKAISQEKLAEELNVSRSAIAKWETDGGIPELDNLIQLAKTFDVSLDELTGNMKKQMNENEFAPIAYSSYDFGNQHYDIELTGWNDGVYDISIMNEDKDFLFYRKMVKTKLVYGIIGKRYIASFLPTKKIADEPVSVIEINRDYFCGKPVVLELAKKEGFIKGLFDFRDDNYRNVVIDTFEELVLRLQFGRELNISEITKIEELAD
ncbi:XRE family transcriptional regulator [Clostridium sp. AF15-17LB]|nr:XRE family transcriptional regulator [Clostridium sp. AF15-17LB]